MHCYVSFNESFFQSSVDQSNREGLCLNLKLTFSMLNETFSSFTPVQLLRSLHKVCPQFTKISSDHGFEQQDASECWIEFIRSLERVTFDNKKFNYKNVS